jgi:dolichol-phosphate mannosyltransferase
MDSSNHSTLVIIPTYNELENLPLILGKVQAALPETHILIVDDGSPDGTGALADQRATEDARIHVLHRTEKNGLGPAYLAGFAWGLDRDYGVIIEMDADGSHPADRLPAMLEALNSPQAPGLVIGSRWVTGGSVVNWPGYRKFISKGGSTYARLMLGLPVRDVTAGFRAFRAEVLRAIDLSGVDSQGYCFQIDLTRRVLAAGYGIVEVPIEFRERELGVSKMSTTIVVEAMLRVTAWGLARPFHALRGTRPSPIVG